MIGTQSELAETQAELDAWTHELNSFQVPPSRSALLIVSTLHFLHRLQTAPGAQCDCSYMLLGSTSADVLSAVISLQCLSRGAQDVTWWTNAMCSQRLSMQRLKHCADKQ